MIVSEKRVEFSYTTAEGTRFTRVETVAQYAALAKTIGILDENLDCVRAKGDIKSLENFQEWLGELTMSFLEQEGAAPSEVARVTGELISASPSELPILQNIRPKLQTKLSIQRLRHCLGIIALLRSKLLVVGSRRLYLSPDVFRIQ